MQQWLNLEELESKLNQLIVYSEKKKRLCWLTVKIIKLWIYETHTLYVREAHIFTISYFIFPGYITNQFNDHFPVGLLAQLVRALHWYCRGQGSNPGNPDFFRLSFRNCISCINNCLFVCWLRKQHSSVETKLVLNHRQSDLPIKCSTTTTPRRHVCS